MNPLKRVKTEDLEEKPTNKVPSTEVARPLTPREIKKQEALEDSVRYAKNLYYYKWATVGFSVLTVLTVLAAIWMEENSGRTTLTAIVFGVVAAAFGFMVEDANGKWKKASKEYLRNEPVFDRNGYRRY